MAAIPNFALTPNRIILAGEFRLIEPVVEATKSFYPGYLLQVDPDKGVEGHATSGGPAEAMLALEQGEQGLGLLDQYTAGQIAEVGILSKGSVALAMLKAGQNINAGDLLMSNGDGRVTKRTGTNYTVFIAMDALNLSASGAVDTLIRVRAI